MRDYFGWQSIGSGGQIVAVALSLALAACGDARAPLAAREVGASDEPYDAAARDAAATTSPDGGPDAGPIVDAAGSRLVFRPLLGGVAPTDRLYDLALDPTSFHWIVPLGDDDATFTRLVREAHPDAPSVGPVLRVRAETRVTSALVTDGLGSGGPLDACVWVGRRIDVGGQLPVVTLLGTGADGQPLTADLVPDPQLHPTEHLEWARFGGRWDAAPIGQIAVSIVDGEEGLDLYVTGPELTEARAELRADDGPRDHPQARAPAPRPPPAARPRARTARDAAILRDLSAARRWRGSPHPALTPERIR